MHTNVVISKSNMEFCKTKKEYFEQWVNINNVLEMPYSYISYSCSKTKFFDVYTKSFIYHYFKKSKRRKIAYIETKSFLFILL